MRVRLCWKTESTPKGKVHTKIANNKETFTIKTATDYFHKNIEPVALEAYLDHFDGWHYYFVKQLKERS